MGQPGKIVNPARGQLNSKNEYFPVCPRSLLRIWSRETRSAVPPSVSLLILQTQVEPGAYSRDSSRVTHRRSMCVILLSKHILTQADVKIQPWSQGRKKHHLEGKHVQATLYFPVCPRLRRRSWKRVRPARPASACSLSKLRLNLVLTHGIPPESRRRYMGVFVVD